jgi:toxin ParE1/3/4
MACLIFSPEAKRDLVEIGLYIAHQSGSLERAENLLDSINQTCELLASQPEMGQLRTEFTSGIYRSFSVGNYVIYFSSISNGIQVARILHGARDHGAVL